MISDTFSRERIAVSAGNVFIRRAGSGPAGLLLHGLTKAFDRQRTIES